MSTEPLIGVPASVHGGVVGVKAAYLTAIRRAGGRPVLLTGPDADPTTALAAVTGLLLPGGADVDPATYGASPHPSTGPADGERDRFEMALARAAIALGMPVLAVCRGMQVLNVALGGSLHQHLPDHPAARSPGPRIDHGLGDPDAVGDSCHDVAAAAGSELALRCGTVIRGCASHHHQGVDSLGSGLAAVGWSDDGLVESAELAVPPGAGTVLAVQWHPERSAATDPVHQALFDSFVADARSRVHPARRLATVRPAHPANPPG